MKVHTAIRYLWRTVTHLVTEAKVYTGDKDSYGVQRVQFWRKDVAKRTTKVTIWPGPSGWGVGYVDLVTLNAEGFITAPLVTKRHYGIVKVELRSEEQK